MTAHDLAGSIQYLGASPTAGNDTITLLLALGGLADEEADQEIGDAADAGADLLGASSGVKLVTGGADGESEGAGNESGGVGSESGSAGNESGGVSGESGSADDDSGGAGGDGY